MTTDTLLVNWGFLSEACQAPNVGLEAVLSTVDHGDLSATFVWEGEDVTTFDVVVPDIATATPSPSPPPTVSPTPTPSTAAVTASPTPYPQSLITVKFVRDGEPATVFFGSFPRAVFADGVACFIDSTEGEGSEFSIVWPRKPGPVQPPSCTKGPPTTVRIDFGASFLVDVLWEGEDITVDAEIPSNFSTIAPLTSPTPTPTANALPDTGGPPVDERGGAGLLLGALALLLATAAAFFVSARVRQGG
ncbi:MAG: hypothetical protein IIC86_02655 [Chloroflexi bacterium]|nr:hypothetical protein [Chloroflexota bacterium]